MSDPAREKQRFGRLIEICGTHAGNAEQVLYVIPRRQDQDDAANDVNRFETDAVDGDLSAIVDIRRDHITTIAQPSSRSTTLHRL